MATKIILKRLNYNLLMNKIPFILAIFSLCFVNLYSQTPTFSNWNNGYLNIYSYEGTSQSGGITLRVTNSGYLNIENWKLAVTATQASGGNGKQFPVDKIQLLPSHTAGQATDPGPVPSMAELGVLSMVQLINGTDVFLVPVSKTPIYNKGTYNSYYDLQMIFSLNVLGGAYLTDLKTNSPQYPIGLTFTLYGANNQVLGRTVINYTFQVHQNLTGEPPAENSYTIKVAAAARSGVLDINKLSDYVNGASVTYTDGLIVSSSTDYQIAVKAVSPTFLSSRGNSLPLDIVNIVLQPASGTQALVSARPLSSLAQVLSTGTSTNRLPVYYNIKYSTNPNDKRLFQSVKDEYTITLQYEITPK